MCCLLKPSYELELSGLRSYGSVSSGLIGTAILAGTVPSNFLGGWLFEPVFTPLDFARDMPARLYTVLAPANTGWVAGDVQIDVVLGYITDGVGPTDATSSYIFTIPASHPISQPFFLELGSEAAPFIPAYTLPPNSMFGIRLVRNGPAAADTWLGSLNVAQTCRLRYSKLCQFCCCG